MGPLTVPPKLLAVHGGNGDSVQVVEPVVGVGDGVADEVVSAAVEGVRSGAGDHVDHGRAGKAVLGAEVRLLDAELVHGLRGRRVGDIGDARRWARSW
jgi:hypothetical protein